MSAESRAGVKALRVPREVSSSEQKKRVVTPSGSVESQAAEVRRAARRDSLHSGFLPWFWETGTGRK